MGLRIETLALEGFNLLEASAGTGKTHALTGLYLRLLLEGGYAPDQILVVTYTKAATAELKTRIRRRLLDARALFGGGESEDPLLQAIHARIADKDRARRHLDLALASFDRAAIFTIHGFCQRVLTDQAFETGQGFDTRLVPDQSDRLQQIVDDFWRREINRLPDLFLQAFRLRIEGPETMLSRLRPAIGKPYLRVRASDWPQDLEQLERQAVELQSQVMALWRRERDRLLALLIDDGALKANIYHPDRVGGWAEDMQQWLDSTPYERPFDKAERFTPQGIEAAVKKGRVAPSHPFFSLFSHYLKSVNACREAFDRAVVALHKSLYDYLLEELPRRQAEAREWSYDDLLLQLSAALGRDRSGRLAALLRGRYRAALVDEFQDTDPVQYRILRRIYLESRQPVFLVGDPKQAIYSFRGADLFAYLHAREETAAQRHTLDVNWRSAPELVTAVNTLFGRCHQPFLDPRIAFEPVQAAAREMPRLKVQGGASAPLQIWRLAFDQESGIDEIRQAVADATAGEIVRLLSMASQARARIGERPLCGGDIAVLVRTHRQASQIAQALRARGIAVVQRSQQSVYESHEAEQLQRLLIALLEPHRAALVHAALATPLLGWDGAAIDGLNRDDASQNRLFNRFFDYHRRWREDGFIAMIRAMALEMEIANRLLGFRDGERRLTNFLHLLELLHEHDSGTHPGMEGLVKWFTRQRQSPSQDDERLLRLESDGELVRIETLHHSKGLEYGIVFTPFLWDESEPRSSDKPFLFHDPGEEYAAVLELGSEGFDENRGRYLEEEFAENLRLLYVALTRACHRCYLPWGLTRQNRCSALAWLLHNRVETDPKLSLASWREHARGLDEQSDDQALQALAGSAQGSIGITPLLRESATLQIELPLAAQLMPARRFSASIVSTGGVASFSSLVAGQHEDRPDYDTTVLTRTPVADQLESFSVHGFPRGSAPGSCLHSILERLDFMRSGEEDVEKMVREKLLLHAIDGRWSPLVVQWMQEVVATPIDRDGLTLGRIAGAQRVNEMEFHFPARSLRPGAIVALARRYRFPGVDGLVDGLANLHAGVADGYVKGYIDLVFEADGRFHLADYKSNWLGNDYGDYHPKALAAAMAEHHYALQYLLYTLALHRYLKVRLSGYEYERHFGAVYYLFLRGMQPRSGPGLGVVAERPSADFIQALDALIGTPGNEPG
jgi:exodeoxyribonuclease V beta subunit